MSDDLSKCAAKLNNNFPMHIKYSIYERCFSCHAWCLAIFMNEWENDGWSKVYLWLYLVGDEMAWSKQQTENILKHREKQNVIKASCTITTY